MNEDNLPSYLAGTEDLKKSIMKFPLGPQKKSRVIDEKDKLDTAIH